MEVDWDIDLVEVRMWTMNDKGVKVLHLGLKKLAEYVKKMSISSTGILGFRVLGKVGGNWKERV